MASLDHHQQQHTFAMFSRQGSEEHQFHHHSALYPDPPHAAFSAAPLDMGLSADAYFPRLSQDLPTSMAAFDHMPFAMDGPTSWAYGAMSPPTFPDDRELGIASNMSTGSVPSAPSSAVGSPRSTHGQPAQVPEWAPQGVAMSPGIVGSHDYFAGTEYSFAPPGMEDLASFAFTADASSKPPGFVGELAHTSTSAAPQLSLQQSQQQQHHQQPQPPSPCVSRRDSGCTVVSSSAESGTRGYTTLPEAVYAQLVPSPLSPDLSRRSSFLASSTTSSSPSPSSPELSGSLSSPLAVGWSPTTPAVPRFFSQSSGHFIAPLGSSCWFPLVMTST